MIDLQQSKEVKRNIEMIIEKDDPLDGYLDAKKKLILKNKDCKYISI